MTATGLRALPVPCQHSPGAAQPILAVASETPQGTHGGSSQDPVCLQRLTAHPMPSPSSHFSHIQSSASSQGMPGACKEPYSSARTPGTLHGVAHSPSAAQHRDRTPAAPRTPLSPDRPHWCPGCCRSWSLSNATGKDELLGAAAGSWAAAPRSRGRCRAVPCARPSPHLGHVSLLLSKSNIKVFLPPASKRSPRRPSLDKPSVCFQNILYMLLTQMPAPGK